MQFVSHHPTFSICVFFLGSLFDIKNFWCQTVFRNYKSLKHSYSRMIIIKCDLKIIHLYTIASITFTELSGKK